MTSTVWTRPYNVDTLVVTPEKRLGLVGLLRILQDIAWIHGAHLGYGFDAMMARGQIWVLARQKLVVSGWPAWGESLDVRTWVRPKGGMFVERDYEIRCGGRQVGEGTACWIVLDAVRRRPMKFSVDDMFAGTCGTEALDINPQKLPARDGLSPLATFDVRYSDLDVNGHVNNTRYAEWVMDALPASIHRGHVVDDYEVNFLAETGVGDRIAIEWDGGEDAGTGAPFHVQGRREGDGKVAFTARVSLSPAQATGSADA